MRIAILGAGNVGSTLGRLWHAAGHNVTFAARDAARPRALAAELGTRAYAASVADAAADAEVVLVAVPGPVVTDVLQEAGSLDRRVMIDAANSFGQQQLRLRSLADAFPQARWVRAFNSLPASVMANDNYHKPPWVAFLSGDAEAKPVVAQLIRDAGFDPVDLGGIDDSRLQDPGGALWLNILTHDEATALIARIESGDMTAADEAAARSRVRELAAPFEKLRDHAPDDPGFFFEHLSRSVSRPGSAGASSRASGTASARRSTASTRRRSPRCRPPKIRQSPTTAACYRNKAKIRATVENAREVLAILDEYGSIRGYLASFPDAGAAARTCGGASSSSATRARGGC